MTILLVNGPYDGERIDDLGAAVIRMSIARGGHEVGNPLGMAIYEPTKDRKQAFWADNQWLGTIEEIIEA